jgi:hypothetical protein
MNPKFDVLALLAAARPSELDPPAGAARRAMDLAVAQHAQHGPHPHGRRVASMRLSRRAGLWGSLGLGAAAAAAAAGVLVLDGRRGPRRTEAAPGSARDFLLAAAIRTRSGGSPASGRYWLTRTDTGAVDQVGSATNRYAILLRQHFESWLSVSGRDQSFDYEQSLGSRPLTAADEAAWRRDGSPAQWSDGRTTGAGRSDGSFSPGGLSAPFTLGNTQTTYAQLQALPTDAVALRAYLTATFPDSDNPASYLEDWLFWTASGALLSMPLPPGVRGAMYGMLGGVEHVSDLGAVTDALGRTGRGVAITSHDGGGTYQLRLIIDPGTGQALALQTHAVNGSGVSAGFAVGAMMRYTASTFNGWTDQTPPRVDSLHPAAPLGNPGPPTK